MGALRDAAAIGWAGVFGLTFASSSTERRMRTVSVNFGARSAIPLSSADASKIVGCENRRLHRDLDARLLARPRRGLKSA